MTFGARYAFDPGGAGVEMLYVPLDVRRPPGLRASDLMECEDSSAIPSIDVGRRG